MGKVLLPVAACASLGGVTMKFGEFPPNGYIIGILLFGYLDWYLWQTQVILIIPVTICEVVSLWLIIKYYTKKN